MADSWETMLGYCMTSDERYGPPKRLNSEEELKAFIVENVEQHYELRIVDLGDLITMQIIDRELLFPKPEGAGRNKWNAERQKFVRC